MHSPKRERAAPPMGCGHDVLPSPFLHPFGTWVMHTHVPGLVSKLLEPGLELRLNMWDLAPLTDRVGVGLI